MDSLLGGMMGQLDKLNLPINTILVSDHGMSELIEKESTYVFLDELVMSNAAGITVVNGGTQAHVYTNSMQQTDSLYNILKIKASNFSVYRQNEFPERWHYQHDRAGDLLIVAKPGKYLATGDRQKVLSNLNGGPFGVHGYDPDEVADMRGIFYARGSHIKRGSKVPAFRNTNIYPLIAEILQMKIPPIDGDFKILKPIYVK
jgi:predicted AlkP superfamily pyrophosphatase or phosphodiesterase